MAEALDRCPDCSAAVSLSTGSLAHDPTCPLGREIDRVTTSDRRWFDAHPGRVHRSRPASWAERIEYRLMSGGRTVRGARLQVEVRRFPGGRSREFRWVGAAATARDERCGQ